MATSLQRPPLYNGHLSTTATSLQRPPLYHGHLSTAATFFCSQGGFCGEAQLYIVYCFCSFAFDNGDMLSPKRYVLIALHFLLKQGALKGS